MSHAFAAIRQFAYTHDDLPAFHASYVVLTFTLAILLNLGAFGFLILIHMGLDVWKYKGYQQLNWMDTIEGVIRESLMDVTLLAVGFVFSVYLHHSISIGSVSTLLRTEFAIVRSIALFIPKIKILHNFLKVIAHIHHYMQQTHPHLRTGWSSLDKFCFCTITISCLLLVVAPEVMHVPQSIVNEILLHEALPWRV